MGCVFKERADLFEGRPFKSCCVGGWSLLCFTTSFQLHFFIHFCVQDLIMITAFCKLCMHYIIIFFFLGRLTLALISLGTYPPNYNCLLLPVFQYCTVISICLCFDVFLDTRWPKPFLCFLVLIASCRKKKNSTCVR